MAGIGDLLAYTGQQQPYLGGLSLAELLAIPAETFGKTLAARGGTVGGPLGLGLASVGGIGGLLAKRQQEQQQQKATVEMLKGMPGVQDATKRGPELADKIAQGNFPAAKPGLQNLLYMAQHNMPVTPEMVMKEMEPKAAKTIAVMTPTGEEIRDAASGEVLQKLGKGEYTRSFGPKEPKVPSFESATFEEWSKRPENAGKSRLDFDAEKARLTHVAGAGGGTVLKEVYDKTTGTTSWKRVPKEGPAGETVGEVRPPMGANPIADMNATVDGLVNLKANINSLGLTPAEMKRPNWLNVWRQKAGFAPSDPRLTDTLAQVSVLNTTLTGLVMRTWGTRNVGAAQEVIKLHVPQVEDSAELWQQKADWWQNVGINQYRTMLSGGPMPPPEAGGAFMLPGMTPPPVPKDELPKLKVMIKSGVRFATDSKGKVYQWDPNTKSWLTF